MTTIEIDFVHCGQDWNDPSCASPEEVEKFWAIGDTTSSLNTVQPIITTISEYVDFKN